MNYTTRTYDTLTSGLRQEWESLWHAQEEADIACSPDWFEAACASFGYDSVAIVTAYTEDTLVAIVPLVCTRRWGVKIYVPPAAEFVSRFSILFASSDPELRNAMCEALARLGLVHLSYVQAADAQHLAKATSLVTMFESDADYPLDFSAGKYGEMTNAKKTRNILNRLKKVSNVSIRISQADHTETLQTCFVIDQQSVKDAKGKGVFWDAPSRRFYEVLAKDPAHMSVYIFYIDGTAVAYMIFFVRNDKFIGSQKAFLSGYEYFNLGFVSLIRFLDEMRPVYTEVNFGRGEDRFKTDFTKLRNPLHAVIISKQTGMRLWLAQVLKSRETAYRALVRYPALYARFKQLRRLTHV